MARITYTPEQRRERMEQAHAEMTAAVEAITTGEQWAAFLDFARKLPSYSAGNRAWLFEQVMLRGWEELGHVCGYRTWQELGRQVRKGEHGLRVLAPCRVKVRDDETGDERWAVRGFTVATVFAACQTEGDGEIPEPLVPSLLTGEGPGGAWEALVALVESHGFTVRRAELFPANGTTSFATRMVTVADRLEPAAAVKTLAHELAHVMLHASVDYHANRGRCEVEAESVAYLVCRELGLSSDAYSFPYVARWGTSAKVVTETAEAALNAARDIVAALVPSGELVAAA